MTRTLVQVLSAALLAVSFGVLADEPSVEEMIDALAPKPTTPLTRGLSRGMKPAPQVREGRLQLSVQFDFASASLTPEGRELLTRLATAMRSANLSQLRYRIEGHTDSSGDPQRNQNLSERRAATVAKFLSSATGIEAQRMNRVGLGSTVPANEVDPKAAENRRVVIVSLEAGEAPPAAEAKAQKGGGVVQQVKGSLYANRAGDTKVLRAGARVAERDVLTTTGRSTALLKMDDGANLLLREDTTIEVRKLQSQGEPGAVGQVFELLVGAFRYVSGSLGSERPDSIAFVTSAATLGLRGTDLDVVHRPLAAGSEDPGTYVKVNRGAVALGGLDGSFVQVAKDQQAYAGKPATLMRGGKSGPVTMRIEAPADMFKTGELDALLPPLSEPIPEYHGVDAWKFQGEIRSQYRPAVLRGLVSGWPAVERGLESHDAMTAYLARFDSGRKVDVLMVPPHARGRIFYNENLSGFNYSRDQLAVSKVAEQLGRYAKFENRPAVAVQSAPIPECLPGFAAENPLAILDEDVPPRIWLGNAVVTPAHFDESANIACVVAGKRRFTLLPPEQVANLYIGPLDYAPTGTPISMVSFREPDFEKFPRFREAQAASLVADLEPGDAIYIPPLWWHHVESLAKYNILVNYWWRSAAGGADKSNSALNVLLLALLSLKHLPPDQRGAWKALFDHYIFDATDESVAHIPAHRRSVLGEISPKLAGEVKAFLVKQLKGDKS